MTGVAEVAETVGSRIGRYFSLVSFVPSLVLVTFVFLLQRSGAWSGPPDWQAAFDALTEASAGTFGVLAIAALAAGLAVHPVQFVLVQLYEGYWGHGDLARRLWLIRASGHSRRADSSRRAWQILDHRLSADSTQLSVEDRLWMSGLKVEMERIDAGYPDDTEQSSPFMATRLGNVLRRYEMQAGAPYGIRAIQAVPFLALVAPERDVKYLDDQRSTLDLVVRLSATSLFATAVAAIYLWDDGLWLLLALVPYAIAYLLYLGAVTVAHEYGTAIATLVALNRPALYRRLRLNLPPTATDEQTRNKEELSELLGLKKEALADFTDLPDSEHEVDLSVSVRPDTPTS